MTKKYQLILLIFLLSRCQAQTNTLNEKLETLNTCNRQVYGSTKYIEKLPSYICIPKGYIIDDYIRLASLDSNNNEFFLAIKYNKREDDQIDGDSTTWEFYIRSAPDTIFTLRQKLNNIVPPFLKDYGLEYVVAHPLADSIFNSYPLRVSHHLSFVVRNDTLHLSYKFDDSYGKTFVFIYNKLRSNWFLENVQYFIGELPIYWWRENEFYYPLNDQLMVIEERKPKKNVSIDKFDLKEAFRYRQKEWMHITEHIDDMDKSKAKTILDVDFKKCEQIRLPESWSY